jgi:hypothetical protein
MVAKRVRNVIRTSVRDLEVKSEPGSAGIGGSLKNDGITGWYFLWLGWLEVKDGRCPAEPQ